MASDRDVDASTKADAQEALASLPSEGVAFACAYGSRYMEGAKTSQLDVLIAVENALLDEWHRANLARNPKHYFLSTFPPLAFGLAKRLQARPPGAFFHTFVENPAYKRSMENGEQNVSRFWKYGVIGADQLVEDLTAWNQLFIAGRLQKPVLKLDSDYFTHQSMQIDDARRQNLKAAAATALSILPHNFSESDLYYMISSLSYAGDVRLLFGAENPNKLSNMIYTRNALNKFRDTFSSTLETLESRGLLYRDRKPSLLSSPVEGFPIYKFEQNPGQKPELIRQFLPERARDAIFRDASSIDDLTQNTKNYVFRTVRSSSSKQFVNNLLMNNPLKSWKYATAKMAKGLLRK